MSDLITLSLFFYEKELARIGFIATAASDPTSPEYSKHLSREQLDELVELPAGERAMLAEWLTGHGMTVLKAPETGKQVMFVHATMEQLESALGADSLRWLIHYGGPRGASAGSVLPRRFAGYVKKMRGIPGEPSRFGIERLGLPPLTDMFLPAISSSGEPAAMPADFGGMTPADIRDIYSFPADGTLNGSGETIALMMLGGRLDRNDLNAFWRAHRIEPPNVEIEMVATVSDAEPHPLHQMEAGMTVEWAGAMAPGAKIVVYAIDPALIPDPWAAFLHAVINDKRNRPTIACTSWITPERRYYAQNGHAVVTGLLTQAAALGITVVSAAGDWGAFDGIPQTIRDGRHVSDAPWCHGVFPAVEDQVLGVGGTMITTRHPLTETGWSGPPPPQMSKTLHFERIAGSGGFSDDVPVPAWQRPVMRGWYSRGPNTPAVVPYGRGFPDVALMAAGAAIQRSPGEALSSQGFQALIGGRWIDYAGGTSVGAPIWAAIIALCNQARRAAGLGRCGFINPLLYKLHEAQPPAFRNISTGTANVSMDVVNSRGRAATYELPGYDCASGWNPVTGLGVPIVTNLIYHACRRESQ